VEDTSSVSAQIKELFAAQPIDGQGMEKLLRGYLRIMYN